MEELFLRFSHLTESIFDHLDNKSLANCRLINKTWCNYLDTQKLLQIRIIRMTVEEFHEVGDPWKRVFETATTKTIMDLKEAVQKFYVKNTHHFSDYRNSSIRSRPLIQDYLY